ncbi:MAG: putative zinc-binding metallopeptidase, partial [Burkholderiaceae bacterium]
LSFGMTTHVIEPDYVSFTRDVLVDPDAPDAQEFLDLVNTWVELTGVLNELSRSMGQRDFYPFVLPHKVVGKLQFVHRVVKEKSLALDREK